MMETECQSNKYYFTKAMNQLSNDGTMTATRTVTRAFLHAMVEIYIRSPSCVYCLGIKCEYQLARSNNIEQL